MHLVQSFIFFPSTRLICRLIFWRFMVLIFEWEREAPFVDPRPHKSHFLAIFLNFRFTVLDFRFIKLKNRQSISDNRQYYIIMFC